MTTLIEWRQDLSIRTPTPERLSRGTGRPVRALARIGIYLVAIGLLGAFAQGGGGYGIFWAIVGTLMIVPLVRSKAASRRAHQHDLHDAAELAGALRSGRLPAAVEPTRLRAEGLQLEPGEVCFADGLPAETFQWYGDPAIHRQGVIVAWGSLGAWIFTAVANFLWWRHNKAGDKKAAPRWRDGELGSLWVTDRRYIILTAGREWVQLRWDLLARVALQPDGIAMVLDDVRALPIKLKLSSPAWHYTLLRLLAYGQIETDPRVRALT